MACKMVHRCVRENLLNVDGDANLLWAPEWLEDRPQSLQVGMEEKLVVDSIDA